MTSPLSPKHFQSVILWVHNEDLQWSFSCMVENLTWHTWNWNGAIGPSGLLGIHYDKSKDALFKELRAGIYIWAKGVENFLMNHRGILPRPKKRFSCKGTYISFTQQWVTWTNCFFLSRCCNAPQKSSVATGISLYDVELLLLFILPFEF